MHAWNMLRAGFAAAHEIDTIKVKTGNGYAGSVLTRIILDAGSWYVDGVDSGITTLDFNVTAANEGKAIQFRTAGGFISNTIEMFFPDDIAGIIAWMDAKTTASLTLVSSTQVSAWASRVGTMIYQQATAGNRPTYSATGRNGQPALTFNPAEVDILTANNPGLLPPGGVSGMVSMVAYSATSNTDYRSIIGWGNGNSGGQYRNFGKYTEGAMLGALSAGPAIAGGQWITADRIGVGRESNVDSQAWSDGVAGTAVASTTLNVGTPTYSHIGKGRNNDPRTWDGSMQEIIVHQAAFSNAERQKMEGYLAAHWSLQARLAANHPYKTLGPRK